MIRIDKYLADMGIGTRSEVKKLLRSGRVLVNGQVLKSPETKVDPQKDVVTADGKQLSYERCVWYMVHKDAGCVTAVRDNLHRTVMELLPEEAAGRKGLSPVGRLDLDTEGLLLVTDDGETAHRLLSPARHVPKEYFVILGSDRELTEELASRFENGLDIGDDKPTAPAKLRILPWNADYEKEILPWNADHEKEILPWNADYEKGILPLNADHDKDIAPGSEYHYRTAVLAVIREGRYHQIKRMFQAVGQEVLYLKRTSFGPLTLDPDLPKGSARKLTAGEVQMLMIAAGTSNPD